MVYFFIFAKSLTLFSLKFWDLSGAKECKSCRSRKMLQNEPLVAIVAVHTAENELLRVWGWFHSFSIHSLGDALAARLALGCNFLMGREDAPPSIMYGGGSCRCVYTRGDGSGPQIDQGLRRRLNYYSISPNFRGSVLGCIDSYDSNQILIFSGFSRSTRFSYFCTAQISKFQQKSRHNFVIFE